MTHGAALDGPTGGERTALTDRAARITARITALAPSGATRDLDSAVERAATPIGPRAALVR